MNALLLKAWLAENDSALVSARLREVRQVDAKSFALHFGGAGLRAGQHIAEPEPHATKDIWLLVSILEAFPVLALIDEAELPATEFPENGFVKALRFQLSGANLIAVAQEGFDRSVSFAFTRRDIYGRETRRALRVELVGRASNAYLLSDKDMVISMFKPVPAGRNSVRRVVTGKPLPPPPPLGKYIAAESTVEDLQRELDLVSTSTEGDFLKEVLSRRVAGSDVHLWPRLNTQVNREWSTTELFEFIGSLQSGALNSQLFGLDTRTANEVALSEWSAARSGASTKKASPAAIPLDNRMTQINAQYLLAQRAEELEQLGVGMLQRADGFANRETEAAFLKGWQLANPDWADRIEIAKSVAENAGAVIEYAQRLKRARPRLQEMLTEGVGAGPAPARAVDSLQVSSKPRPAADPLERDLSKLERSGVKYLRYVTSDGIAILVGQSDRSNDELVRHYGSSRHLWLHVRDYPGSHVLLLTNGKDVPQRSLEEAAVVAGYYSQGRGEIELEISYTPVKQLRRPRGGKPGQVLKLSEKVIRVNPMRFETIRDQLRIHSA